MIFGERLMALREGRKLTQEELSQKLGISRAALSHYEKGRREPDYEMLQRVADYFGVSVDYLIGRTGNPGGVLDEEVRAFADGLELSDTRVLERFALTVDGRELTEEEAKRFIAFVRAERSMK